MKKLTLYSVCHDSDSLKILHNLNNSSPIYKELIVLIAGKNRMSSDFNAQHTKGVKSAMELCHINYHIENFKSLLTFTAWWAIVNNPSLLKTPYVGIFEYDTQLLFDKQIEKILKPKTIIGFNPRKVNGDPMYLNPVPGLTINLPDEWVGKALMQEGWNATTNLIMPKEFLIDFVEWYWDIIPKLLLKENHPHFHERAINIFAVNNGWNFEYYPQLTKHFQLKSHNIEI